MKISDDGLRIPEVGIWAKEKYGHIQTYCSMFTRSMKPPKWQSLVYIDLFAGPGARTVQKEWITEIRDQCVEAGLPFFFKQWGGVRKKQNGKVLDGRVWNEFPLRLALP